MSIILLIIAAILILNIFPKLFGFILQLAIVAIGFTFHPILGIFILGAFVCDWLGLTKKKDAKPKEESNRTRTNFYEEQRKQEEYKRQQEEYKRKQEQYRRQEEQRKQEEYKRQQEEYKRKQEQYRKQEEQKKRRQHQEQQRQKTYQQPRGFFTGCTTKEQLKKRHRELCKKYHPDKGGDPEIFKKMQAEYEMLKRKFQ